MTSFQPPFDADEVVEHWSEPADPREVRRRQQRLQIKRAVWGLTFGAAESVKRILDVGGSVGALTVFGPMLATTAVLIKLEDGGPIFYRQVRVGRGGKPFEMLKFRSMVTNADKLATQLKEQNEHGAEAVTFKIKDDPRVTKVGRLIRKYSIDEFPQFFNVFLGQMSLVGPRPPLPREVNHYKAWQLRRLKVKPGITCLWQIGGRSEIDFEGQVRLDLEYIASESLLSDLKILARTIPAVLSGRGAY